MAEAMRNASAATAPLRPVRLGPSDVTGRAQARRHDRSALAAPARSPIPTRSRSGWSTGPRPRRTACSWRSAPPTAPGASSPTRDALSQVRSIAQALLERRSFAGAADRHPLRQRHRARAARARRDDDRRSLRADLGALLADVERLRQAQVDHRDADARAWSIADRRQAVRPRHRRRRADRRRDRRRRPIRSAAVRPRRSPTCW